MAGKTRRFGLNFFGGTTAGSLGEEQGKFTGADRVRMDAILATLESHDHLYHPPLPSPTGSLTAELDENGSIPAGLTLNYVVTFVDSNGLESQAGDEVSISTPAILPPPAMPQVDVSTATSALPAGLYYYALTALRGSEESTLGPAVSTRVFAGEVVTLTLPALGAATSFRIWRMSTTDGGYTKIGTSSTGTFVDAGAVPADPCACDPGNLPPFFNTGVSKYSVIVSLGAPDTTAVQDAAVVAWRLYRTEFSGVYSASSLVHEVVETVDEFNPASNLLVAWEDAGDALSTGSPPLFGSTLDIPVYTLPSAGSLPPIAGYPDNYPLVVSGSLYISDNGEWKTSGGSGGGTVPGTETVRLGQTSLTDAEALLSNRSVIIGHGADMVEAFRAVVIGHSADAAPLLASSVPGSEGAIAIGADSFATDDAVALGTAARADGTGVVVGTSAYANAYGAVAVGTQAEVRGAYEGVVTETWAPASFTAGTAGNGTVPNATYRATLRSGTNPPRRLGPTWVVTGVAAVNGSVTFDFTIPAASLTFVGPSPVVEIWKVEATTTDRGEGSFSGTLVGSAAAVSTAMQVVVASYLAAPRVVWTAGYARQNYGIAIGEQASVNVLGTADTFGAMAVGALSSATKAGATALGYQAVALGTSSTAVGEGASTEDAHTRGTAVGAFAYTTSPNQVMLGRPGDTVACGGGLLQLGVDAASGVTVGQSGGVPVSRQNNTGAYTPVGSTKPLSTKTAAATLTEAEAGSLILSTSATAVTITVPLTPNLPLGATYTVAQIGTGQVTFEPASGVTLRATPGLKIDSQYGAVDAVKIGAAEWLLVGKLVA